MFLDLDQVSVCTVQPAIHYPPYTVRHTLSAIHCPPYTVRHTLSMMMDRVIPCVQFVFSGELYLDKTTIEPSVFLVAFNR